MFCDLEQRAFLYIIQIQKAIKENADISNTRSFKKNFIWKKTTSVTDQKKLFANILNIKGLISISTGSKN